MAVTYDSDLEAVATAQTSITISSLAVANNANRLLVIGVAGWDATAGDSLVSGVTWGGSATGALLINTELGPGANVDRATQWRILAPAVATADVVVSFGGTCSEIGASAISLYGVDQTTPTGTPADAEGDNVGNPTVTVGSVAAGDMVVDCMYVGKAATAGAGQTARANSVVHGTSTICVSTQPGSSGGVMSWSMADSDTGWTLTAVAVKEAAAGGQDTPELRSRRQINQLLAV